MLQKPCVGGEASPSQNALPHSLQPTQGFRSITSFSQLVILSLHQSSAAILRVLKRGLDVKQQSVSDRCCTNSPTHCSVCVLQQFLGYICAGYRTV